VKSEKILEPIITQPNF